MTGPVVIVAPSDDPHRGGVERFAVLLRDALRRDGIAAEIVPVPATAPAWITKLGLAPIYAAWTARARLLGLRPSLVVSNGTLGAFGRLPVRRIHVYHGTMPAHSVAGRGVAPARTWLIRGVLAGGLAEFLSGLGARRVAVSNSAANEVRRFYRLSVDDVITNGVMVRPLSDGRRSGALFVGRREIRKGYDVAVAAAILAGEDLAVAGPGSDSRTIDLGVLDDSGLSTAYDSSAALLFPTRYEACSYVILEALAAGTAVVTTDVGWTRDLLIAVPEYERFIVPLGDPAATARVLSRAVSRDDADEEALARARDYVRRHNSLAAFEASWIALIRRLVVGAP